MSKKIKACLCCNSRAEKNYIGDPESIDSGGHKTFVSCTLCGLSTRICDTESEAIATWNHRATDDRIKELEAELKAMQASEKAGQDLNDELMAENAELKESTNILKKEIDWLCYFLMINNICTECGGTKTSCKESIIACCPECTHEKKYEQPPSH